MNHTILDNLKIGLIGCGYWGKNLLRNFSKLGVLKSICDFSESGRKLAEELAPNAIVYNKIDDLLNDSEIKGIVIATPAETHIEIAEKALRKNKDVFVEKPMALNVHDAIQMKKIAEENGRILMVGHLLEYHPAIERLKDLLAKGSLGKLNYIYSNRLNFGKIRTEENALWSFAPHDVAVILRLAGELPREVTCSGGSFITPDLADVTVSCLNFHSGIKAHIFVSWLNPFKEQKLVLMGEDKMAVFNDVSIDEKLAIFNQKVHVIDNTPVLNRRDKTVEKLPDAEPLYQECKHFLECIKNRVEPLSDAQSGIDVLKVLEACQHSLENNGKAVHIQT